MQTEYLPHEMPATGGWYFDEKAQRAMFLMPPYPGVDDAIRLPNGKLAYRNLWERDQRRANPTPSDTEWGNEPLPLPYAPSQPAEIKPRPANLFGGYKVNSDLGPRFGSEYAIPQMARIIVEADIRGIEIADNQSPWSVCDSLYGVLGLQVNRIMADWMKNPDIDWPDQGRTVLAHLLKLRWIVPIPRNKLTRAQLALLQKVALKGMAWYLDQNDSEFRKLKRLENRGLVENTGQGEGRWRCYWEITNLGAALAYPN